MSRIVFENATLFDGLNPEAIDPMFILVDGREIKEVSDRPIKAEGGERIDCRGKTLMPGLIDNVEECERHGAYVCAHCHPTEAIRRCVEYGVRSIEHGTLIDEDTAAFVAQRGAYVVPTMAVVSALADDGPKLIEASRKKLKMIQERALAGLQIMKRAGVKMGFGTDLLGAQHVRQGTEFTLRSQVLTPFDILHSATAVNAEILQMKDKLGVVKPGAFADLLVVYGNPLKNIDLLATNGRHLTHIMIDGRFVKRPTA